jgi:predicted DNA-binding protein (UPF0251 family)
VSTYAEELIRCKRVLILRAVIEAGGNQSAAAKVCGVHRNTVWRAVQSAGYDMESLKKLARAKRKPVASVRAVDADRRSA